MGKNPIKNRIWPSLDRMADIVIGAIFSTIFTLIVTLIVGILSGIENSWVVLIWVMLFVLYMALLALNLYVWTARRTASKRKSRFRLWVKICISIVTLGITGVIIWAAIPPVPIEPVIVEIPQGYFLVGCKNCEPDALLPHSMYLDRFFISKFEITNGQFQAFLDDKPDAGIRPSLMDDTAYDSPDQPVVDVTWYEAGAYCDWLSNKTGKDYRLPTEAEWEKAARGTDGREYPWGNGDPTLELANFSRPFGKPARVGSYPNGRNPDYGVMDMAGNAAEWCSNTNDRSQPVVRGGSWKDGPALLRSPVRITVPATTRREIIGFRVVLIP